MLKSSSDIYEIIDLVYYSAKIFGMAPYTKILDAKERIYVASSISLKHIIHISGISFLLVVTCVATLVLDTNIKQIKFHEYVQGTVHSITQITTIGQVLEIMLNQKYFMSCLKLINKSDQLVKEMGFVPSYRAPHRLFFVLALIFPFHALVLTLPVWNTINYLKTSEFFFNLSRILLYVNLGAVYIIKNCVVFYHLSFVLIIHNRFLCLNEYLQKLTHKRATSETIRIAIARTRSLHNTLCRLTFKINKTFAWSVVSGISLTFMEIICLAVILNYSPTRKDLHAYPGLASFDGTIWFIVMVYCQKVKLEAVKTRRLLSQLSPHFDKEVLVPWIFALLQLLHEEVNFTACECYDLDVTVVTNHLGLFCTITMTFLKINM